MTSEVDVGQILQDVGVIDGGMAVRHLDVAPAFERREQHEQVGGAVALVLVIDAGRALDLRAADCWAPAAKANSGLRSIHDIFVPRRLP